MPASEAALLRAESGADVPDHLNRGTGCRECLGSGYRGRTGLFEFMIVEEEARELILRSASAGEIRKAAMQRGMKTLRMDGLRHVGTGRTTLQEVLRVTKDERLDNAANRPKRPNRNGGVAMEAAPGADVPSRT